MLKSLKFPPTKSLTLLRVPLQPRSSFPGFSPTRPTERERVGRVGENPGNEVGRFLLKGVIDSK